MTAKIKQWKNDGPDCDLCKKGISYDGYFLSFRKECSRGMVHDAVICESCLDEKDRELIAKKCGNNGTSSSLITDFREASDTCPECHEDGEIRMDNINILQCLQCNIKWRYKRQ